MKTCYKVIINIFSVFTMTQNTIPDLSTELKPAMENLRTSLHVGT